MTFNAENLQNPKILSRNSKPIAHVQELKQHFTPDSYQLLSADQQQL